MSLHILRFFARKTLKASPLSNRKSERLAAQDTLGESTLKECPFFSNGKTVVFCIYAITSLSNWQNKKRPGEPDLFFVKTYRKDITSRIRQDQSWLLRRSHCHHTLPCSQSD